MPNKPFTVVHRAPLWKSIAAGALLASTAVLPLAANAGEGGTSHVVPGATATLLDFPGTAPAWFVKPMYLNYQGDISALIPTAAGLAGNVDATVNTLAIAAGRTFEQTVLGGAHYTVAVALPYTWLDISANVLAPGGTIRRDSKVSGFGDMVFLPVMLAWKSGEWQIDATLPIFAPTGSYVKGRLGNPGLNYWTFDPTIGAVYSSKSGFNAMLHMGYSMNTENDATHYKSGSLLHLEGAIQQMLPVSGGIVNVGVEGFWFDQTTCDSGSGATLGCFKGRTAGVGPLLGYIRPMGKQTLLVELKWLAELETKRRLDGDYIWLKMVYKF